MKSKDKKPPHFRRPAASRRPAAVSPQVRGGCPIVGVGASAGGLEAFTELLRQLPLDTGFGFVLVQHLDPQHESSLAQLLARVTAMPVREAANNLRVAPNHVYIIPPNTNLGIRGGVLKLLPRSRNLIALRAIDFFFEALAKDQRERAIGVILSGTATDGTLGLEAVKAEGGLTFAQDDSARYDSMPRSAVAAGCVDLVLPPGKIAKELTRIAKHPYVANRVRGRFVPSPKPHPESAGKRDQDGYQKIILLLHKHTGVDFSLYKSATLHRRVTRRMVLNRRDTLANYADFLQGNAKELDALYSDALISVTSFFRNADAFDALKHKVFARLLQQRGNEPLRVWVLGCSTGQEAYSIAMAYAESADKIPHARKLQVFATDLNEANLNKARQGFYPKSLVQDVSPERLRRFFTEEEGCYRVIKSLRERVVFARQNVISDPPFSRMDLISCRNVMIYLEPSLQKKVFPAFHYALKPEGFLFLGASESVGGFGDLFTPVDKKQKIFSRKAVLTLASHLPVRKEGGGRVPHGKAEPRSSSRKKMPGWGPDDIQGAPSAEREADRVTVNQFAPPGVLINADLQILQFRGSTGAYLEPPTGKANFDLLRMARNGLMLPLRATINTAKKNDKTARTEDVPVTQNGRTRAVHVEVVPLKNLKERCFLVLFEDAGKRAGAASEASPLEQPDRTPGEPRVLRDRDESSRVARLERDLAEARDYLQSVQEHQEASNEELQASNEEGQSANEELQSLNEELETSKEELESTNEELTTVNEEMATRNTELNRLNSDLTNLQTSTKLVIVLLGRDHAIRRFSAQAEKQFSLLATDVGRPIGAVRHNLLLPDLDGAVADVIATGRESEREVRDNDGRWHSLRLRPYLDHDHKVDGAVMVLLDIDELKRTERLIAEEHEHAEAVIRTVANPLLILSSNLCLQSANDAFYRMFKVSSAETRGVSIFAIDHGSWNIPRLRHFLEDVIPRKSSFDDFEVTHNFERIGRRSLLLNGRILNESGRTQKEILLGIQDITEVLAFQADLRRSERRYRRLFEASQDGILILDPATRRIADANPFIVKLLGYSRRQLLKKELWEIGLLKDETANQEAFRELKAKGFIRYEDLPLESRGGRRLEVEFVSNLYDEGGDEVIQCNIRDITRRKQAEEELRSARNQLAVHAGKLEGLVAERTAALTATNRRLAASVDSIRKGKEEYRKLLAASQAMQEKLRHLTRQIITAQEEERKQISRELHDEVVQTLVGINVELSAIGKGASLGAPGMKEKIAHTQQLVENSVTAVHRFARGLRPAVLDDLGLIPALHAFCKSLGAKKGLNIQMTAFSGVEALGDDERTVLFRVAQEALNNVTRHAHATRIKISIDKIPGAIRMEINDNGQSFRVEKIFQSKNPKRLGLIGMKERVEMVGGTLAIESAPGLGTTVRADIPFAPEKKKISAKRTAKKAGP